MNRLLALVGLPGAGKSVVTEKLTEAGYKKVYFGGITMEKLKESGLEVNEKNEKMMREKLRKDYGMAAYATLNIPNIKNALKSSPVVIDGLYSWEEYLVLKKEFPTLEVVAVYSPPKLRYLRLSTRQVRPLTQEQAMSRDYSQIENLHQAGPIAMADFTIDNSTDLENLLKQVKILIDEK